MSIPNIEKIKKKSANETASCVFYYEGEYYFVFMDRPAKTSLSFYD